MRTIGIISVVRDLAAAGLLDRLRLVVFPVVFDAYGREPAIAGYRCSIMELVGYTVLDGRRLAPEYRQASR